MRDVIKKVTGTSLRLLTRLGSSELLARLGWRGATEQAVYRGTKAGFQAAQAAARRFKARKAADHPERLVRPEQPKLFDLRPTEEQQMMRDGMRRFAEEVLRPAAEQADETCTPPTELLDQIHELGITMMAVPEPFGGAGQVHSAVSNVIVAEELARGDMGLAYAALSPLAVVQALVEWGTAEQQARYLPAFVEESFVPAALAVLEPRPLFDPHALRAGAVRDGDGWTLHGDKAMVALGETAELFLVAASVAGLGSRLFVVQRQCDGVALHSGPVHVRNIAEVRRCYEPVPVDHARLNQATADDASRLPARLESLQPASSPHHVRAEGYHVLSLHQPKRVVPGPVDPRQVPVVRLPVTTQVEGNYVPVFPVHGVGELRRRIVRHDQLVTVRLRKHLNHQVVQVRDRPVDESNDGYGHSSFSHLFVTEGRS